MFHRFHDRFGTAGLVIAVIALIAALGGTALAASGALTAKQKKEVKAIAKSFQGTGPQGAPGTNGTNGTNGKEGPQGKQGEPGKAGENGKEGSPWTLGGTLPGGKSLKGEWSLSGTASGQPELEFEEGKAHLSEEVILKIGGAEAFTDSFSFALPLAEAPVKHYIRANGKETIFVSLTEPIEEVLSHPACPGSAAEPKATAGNLCVYAAQEENTEPSYFGVIPLPGTCSFDTQAEGNCLSNSYHSTAASPFGFGLEAVSKEAGAINVYGTWAVTAE